MTSTFYDDLASSYHLIFADWQASFEKERRMEGFVQPVLVGSRATE